MKFNNINNNLLNFKYLLLNNDIDDLLFGKYCFIGGNCGWPNITEPECLQHGCCFNKHLDNPCVAIYN
jgi:hypothetical protein